MPQLQREEGSEVAFTNCLASGLGVTLSCQVRASQSQDPELAVGRKGPEWEQGLGPGLKLSSYRKENPLRTVMSLRKG